MIIIPVGDDNPRKTVPWVNWLLIIVNVAVFASYALASEAKTAALFEHYALVPSRWRPEALLTSMFLHGGVAHLLGNMLFLWITGDNVEDRLGHFGYLVFYATAGAVAGLAHVWHLPHSDVPCVGASGAISGVMAAYLVLFPRVHIRFWGVLIFVVIFRTFSFQLPAWSALGFWFLQQLLMQWLAGRDPGVATVAYDAHIGGFAAGLLLLLPMRLAGLVKGGRTH